MKRTALLAALTLGACGGSNTNNPGGTVHVTASGEVLALGGYAFPPAMQGDADFVDGWEVKFDKLLAVFDRVTLSESPDTSPGDQSQTGKLVAELDGPWAVDLHRGGPLAGKGGSDEQAVSVGVITNQNKNGGAPFDPAARYAFGFDSVPATADTKLVNLDAGDADYAEMVERGWNVLYVGTATWKGVASSCTSTNTSYPFSKLPTTVKFRLGFATPTSYLNCQNPDNDPAKALGGEEHERGIAVTANAATVAQVTFHTDHPFWESFVHDSPAHFDQLAALAKPQSDGTWLVSLDDAKGADYTAFTDSSGAALPWRACDPGYVPPNANAQMGFSSLSIGHSPSGDPSTFIRDYADYASYDQSTQGHLDSDGLCYVQRRYPSPR